MKILKIQRFPVGILRTNSYLISYNDRGIIVDPGGISEKLDENIKKLNGIDYIILTHGHFDHILEVKRYSMRKNICCAASGSSICIVNS